MKKSSNLNLKTTNYQHLNQKITMEFISLIKGKKRFEIEDFNNLGDYSSILYDGIGDSSLENMLEK